MKASKLLSCVALLVTACAEPVVDPDASGRDAAADAASRDSSTDARGQSDVAMTDASRGDVPSAQDVQQPRDVASADPYEAARVACVAEINRYRAMNSLPPYQRWTEGEACADRQAAFDAMTGIPHNGFSMSICSPRGNGQNECPRYGGPEALNGCLAQMWAEGPSPDGMWSNAHGHYLNMIGDYIYMGFRVQHSRVACGFSAGGWMVQNFQ
ncbi:MAG: hypothetical protein JNK05_06435 [Myxococcales bacterium]|nr:hypothetical protein [Myxococcales bacterium]